MGRIVMLGLVLALVACAPSYIAGALTCEPYREGLVIE